MNFKKTLITATVMSVLLGGIAVYAETETHATNGAAAVVSSSSVKMHEGTGLTDIKKAEMKKAHEAKRAEMEAKKAEMKKAHQAKRAEMEAKKTTASTTPVKTN